MRKIYMNFPITHDIVDAYRTYRRNGNTRGDAIAKLRAEYAQELADCDDGPVVRIGLALALCQKRELTSDVLKDALWKSFLQRTGTKKSLQTYMTWQITSVIQSGSGQKRDILSEDFIFPNGK